MQIFQIYLTARHLDLTDGLRTHVERHLKQALAHHTSVRVVRMEVQLYKVSEREVRYGCHVLLELVHGHDINIREEDHDLYEAIDLAQKRLVQAVTDYRDRRLTEGRHSRKYSFERLTRALGFGRRRVER
jgi:ribosomal subunit interface protein